ncbi:histidine phosphatase family protein [Exiguobacterium sp. s193]|uniref:histidine phosphatase family protein n=1 Tax=Exiguobacterium sp. s193 TaxID=2751207 RepID=UPI001BE6CED1|nr:histidine phosphatase family protein [Exiguobacterium sp. s193]
MKTIGLVRHHRVTEGYPTKGWISASDIEAWIERYDSSAIDVKPVELGQTDWTICYASSMPRAIQTAKSVYEEDIIVTDLLREVPFPTINSRIRLPFLAWAIIGRLVAPFSKRIQAQIKDANQRIEVLLNQLAFENDERVLLVGHGGMMILMRTALKKRGYTGPRFRHPRNGMLYQFEKSEVRR